MVSLNNLLSEIASLLELTDTQFDNIKSSYEAVARWLNMGDTIQKYGKVEIFPQGSIGLGTVVKPLRGDEYDVDMVLFIDRTDIPAKELKRIIGNRLKEHSTYKRMLDEEGKRCWTLVYAASLSYHMDILPTKADTQPKYHNGIPSILATDKDEITGIYTDKSTNPRGYLEWFLENARKEIAEKKCFNIERIEEYPRKTNLQKIVQLLKRHRDVYFDSLGIEDDIPLSIIITTIAATEYRGGEDLWSSLLHVSKNLEHGILRKNDKYYVYNPTDCEENFAEKWDNTNKKSDNFFKWIEQLNIDLHVLSQSRFPDTSEQLSKMFGESITKSAYSTLSDNVYKLRESGKLKTDVKTGILGTATGETVSNHTFYGKE